MVWTWLNSRMNFNVGWPTLKFIPKPDKLYLHNVGFQTAIKEILAIPSKLSGCL